jgi:protein-tyrosine-phosphatase
MEEKMKRYRLAIVALLVTGAVLALSGCGGSSSSSGTKPLSKAELATQANKICAQFSKKLNAIPTPTTQAEFPKAFNQVATLAESRASELKKLTPSSGQKGAFEKYLQLEDQQIQRIRDLASAYAKGDTANAAKITTAGNTADKTSNALLKQLGADTCAK